MHWNARNGSVPIGNTQMSFVSFGQGDKAFVILPGLSDGLATVRGKALLLAAPYRKFIDDWTVYMFSSKDELPEGYSIREIYCCCTSLWTETLKEIHPMRKSA